MQGMKKKVIALSLMLSLALVNIGYSNLNNPNRGVNSLMTDLDQTLPFIKVFILPYISWYLFVFLALIYFGLKDWRTYKRTLIAMNIGMLVSYSIYYVYQTTVPRPELVGMDWLTQVIQFVYRNDQPYNCFPSIHCLTSYLMFRGIQASPIRNRLNTLIIGGMAFTIIISTLLVKQHTVLDVLGAILLGDLALLVAKKIEEVSVTWGSKQSLLILMRKRYVTLLKSNLRTEGDQTL